MIQLGTATSANHALYPDYYLAVRLQYRKIIWSHRVEMALRAAAKEIGPQLATAGLLVHILYRHTSIHLTLYICNHNHIDVR